MRPRSTTLKSTHAKGKWKGKLKREQRRRESWIKIRSEGSRRQVRQQAHSLGVCGRLVNLSPSALFRQGLVPSESVKSGDGGGRKIASSR